MLVRLGDLVTQRVFARAHGATEGRWLESWESAVLRECRGEVVDGRWLAAYGESDAWATIIATISEPEARPESESEARPGFHECELLPSALGKQHFRSCSPDCEVGDLTHWIYSFFGNRPERILNAIEKRVEAWLTSYGEDLSTIEDDDEYGEQLATARQLRSPAVSLACWREAVLGQ